MRRVVLLILAVAALLVALTTTGTATPSRRAKPPKSTTTTTVAPTTTTIAPTTTTAGPTTTTAAGCVPGTPITITVGGTYTGCYRSTDPATPAVRLQTAQPVLFDHARIEHTGKGLEDSVFGTQVTLQDSTFTQLPLTQVVNHRAVELEQVGSFTADHNRLTDGDGMWIGGPTSGPITVRYNDATDIGRYPHPTAGNCCVQFLQLDHVVSASIEVAWNRVTNTPGSSDAEDVINFYASGGTDSAHRSQVHHNLLDGSYDRSLSGDDTGTGMNLGDFADAHNYGHDNTLVSTTNAGIGISQADNYADNNLIVSDGAPQADPNGQAILAFENVTPPGAHATGNRVNFHRSTTDPTQWTCYMSAYCTGTTIVTLTEDQARAEWETSRQAAGVTVGPRP